MSIYLPEEFQKKMQRLLGVEYGEFLSSYDCPRQFGLRVNVDKISPEEFERLAPFHLRRIPWTENGYYYEEEDAPARHPFYYAGLYYLQEPSAMTPASRLVPEPGDRVLDLCAAPGGKATELAARLHGRGLLVANDLSASRAKALLKNLEIFGITNSFVVNEPPARLAEAYPEFFDKILVDAPCSGEGMFRKDPAAARAWTPQKPLDCAGRQKEILYYAAQMLAPGGLLLYSTCTFSPEENEQVILNLLESREDFELLDIPWQEGFSHGKPEWAGICGGEEQMAGGRQTERTTEPASKKERQERRREQVVSLHKCVRIWPHRMAGEGHFLALLQRRDHSKADSFLIRRSETERNSDPSDTVEGCKYNGDRTRLEKSGQSRERGQFGKGRNKAQNREREEIGRRRKNQGNQSGEPHQQFAALSEFFRNLSGFADPNRLEIRKNQVYYVPEGPAAPRGLTFLRNGLYLGELRKDRFEPSQSLAMALRKEMFPATVNLDCRDPRVEKYLRGETIEVDDQKDAGEKGWQLVCVNGYPLGWGRLSGGILKNKYHPGWRKKY